MMSVPSAALSIHNFINKVGADCGFAAIIGLALLILLYFAHARETSTLRDTIEDAHERISGLELRIQQLIQQQSLTRQASPQSTIAPAPSLPTRAMGSAVASLRREPAPTAVASSSVHTLPFASERMAAPSLGSATKLIPDPARITAPAQGLGQTTAALTAATVAGETVVDQPLVAAGATAVFAAPAPRPGGGNGGPPRVQIRPGAVPPANPAPTAGVPRRTVPLAGSGNGRVADQAMPRRSFARRVLPVLLGLIVVAVIVVALITLTKSGTSGKTTVSQKITTSKHKHSKTAAFKTSKWTVSVLNGTAVAGLAADVSTVLTKKGYKQGPVTNAASQTVTSTIVYYKTPKAKLAAQKVAKALSLKASHVRAATPTATQSCATTPTGTAGTCNAQVIVSVGSDKASLAASGTATSS